MQKTALFASKRYIVTPSHITEGYLVCWHMLFTGRRARFKQMASLWKIDHVGWEETLLSVLLTIYPTWKVLLLRENIMEEVDSCTFLTTWPTPRGGRAEFSVFDEGMLTIP